MNDAAVGNGAVDDPNVVYYLKEQSVGGFQSWLIFFDPSGTQSVAGSITFASSREETPRCQLRQWGVFFARHPRLVHAALACTAEMPPKQAETAQRVVGTLNTSAVRRQMAQLRRWFRAHGRDLPWRRTRDPYHVLVSELMLQQTQVSRVVDYYERWLKRFPTLHHVAKARPSKLRESWDGLGYYARVRNLHKLAREVAPRCDPTGALPRDPALLKQLPGIGAYTAGAVSSFAYERRAPLVDTNVARVLLRLYAPEHTPKSGVGQKVAWALAEAVLPRTGKSTWTHNQAIMELGALVCTARIAHCASCPLKRSCKSADV